MSTSTIPRILVIHGPNLNTLGHREPHIYGNVTLESLHERLAERARELHCTVSPFQSNHEGAIIDLLQSEASTAAGIVINPGGLTHTSVSLRDALAATGLPAVEVHLSNVYRREPMRHHSMIADVVAARIMGFGAEGYALALRGVSDLVEAARAKRT